MSRTAIVLPKSAETVQAKSHFDPKALRKLLDGAEEEIAFASDNSVEDDDDERHGAARLRDFKALGKQIEAYEEELKRPHLDALAKVRTLVKPFKDLALRGVAVYASAIESYRIELAKERAAATEAAAAAARSRQPAQLAGALQAVQSSKPQRLEGVSLVLRWEVEAITDLALVPREFLRVDVVALNKWAAEQPCIDPDKPPSLAGVAFKVGSSKRVLT